MSNPKNYLQLWISLQYLSLNDSSFIEYDPTDYETVNAKYRAFISVLNSAVWNKACTAGTQKMNLNLCTKRVYQVCCLLLTFFKSAI
jgi:hypothetical protein